MASRQESRKKSYWLHWNPRPPLCFASTCLLRKWRDLKVDSMCFLLVQLTLFLMLEVQLLFFFLHPQNILAYISYSFYCFYFTSTKYSSLYFLRKTQLSIVLPDSGYFFNLYEINMSHVSHDKVCSSSRGKMLTVSSIKQYTIVLIYSLSQTIK